MMEKEFWQGSCPPQANMCDQMDWSSQGMFYNSVSLSEFSQNDTEPSINTSAARYGIFYSVADKTTSSNPWESAYQHGDFASNFSSVCSSASTLASEKSYQVLPRSYAQSFAPAPSFDFTRRTGDLQRTTNTHYCESETHHGLGSLSIGPGLANHYSSQWERIGGGPEFSVTSSERSAARCKSYNDIEEFSLGPGYPP